ncbi:MAG: hypothetical protein IJT02_03050 [Synergistaceae bacterium]|nr:hypothetical protein [Synergistaceae bacterium]
MKRRAFILTEILTGLMLQSMFIITLFGAFYMLLTFGTSTQQTLAANDSGQTVINYVDNRIRNAGLGLWKCGSPLGVAEALGLTQGTPTMTALTTPKGGGYIPFDLPVAVLSSEKGSIGSVLVTVSEDGVYEGNVLVLLHAHKDNDKNLAVLKKSVASSDAVIAAGGNETFKFIKFGEKLTTNFSFLQMNANIKGWAVTEASGVPFRVRDYQQVDTKKSYNFSIYSPYKGVTIHPMSELLNLECQKLWAESNSFYFANIDDSGTNWNKHPHTSGILELHMTLDTKPAIPILDLQVLVSEGLRDDGQTTSCPPNWPSSYWKSEFGQHRVHVSQAAWKLYNLAPLFH